MSIAEVNEWEEHKFVGTFGPVFENSPWIAREAWENRPFRSREELLEAFIATVEASEISRQLALIKEHPDLAGRLAAAGRLTEESSREQAAAGLDEIDEKTKAAIRERNQRYRERFGFPFVICARLHRSETILEAFDERLGQTPERERETALEEIFKIARLRLFDLVTE